MQEYVCLWTEIKDTALVVWTGTSIIGQSIAHALWDIFDVIKTSKDSSESLQLDILSIPSIKLFIQQYKEKYGDKPIATLFLNSGVMNQGKDIYQSRDVIKKYNNGDKDIAIHLNNVVLLERLAMAWIITPATKVIYNASAQIVDPKSWYEDYAVLKKLVSNLILNDERWNATILCPSLVQWTAMTAKFEQACAILWKSVFAKYIKQNMPWGQPTLQDIDAAVQQIVQHPEETKQKFVFVDGGSVYKNKRNMLDNDCLVYDKNVQKLVKYK